MITKTSLTEKLTIFGTSSYFIIPIYIIHALAPISGFADDAGVIGTALLAIQRHIIVKHRKKLTIGLTFYHALPSVLATSLSSSA
jgi:uncharacterized membrane protein YkvA (DUF1232 family)